MFGKRKKRKKKRGSILKNILMFIFALFLFSVGLFLMWVSTLKIPSLSNFELRQVAQSTKIYASDGKTVLFDVHKDIRRTYVPLDQISRHIKNATIAIEDTEFYSHKGVRPKAILRAAIANILEGGYKQGGSTITQQVIKNALLTREKTISRKVKEIILALKLERIMTKDQILETYLNEAPYGGNILGVEEASRRFFGKSAKDVTLAEAAYLAALPKAPSYYSPYGPNKDKLEERKNLVLYRMYETGFITEEEYKAALNEKVEFQQLNDANIKAPHFVFYVLDILKKRFGEEAVYTGGLRVVTTLDIELQDKLQEIIKKHALENEEKFNAENAAAVVLDAENGNILAMVGSRDYFDENIDGKYNVAIAKRQPGSTFKPIVYVRAFEKGLTPSTVMFDVPTQFSTNCKPNEITMDNGCYAPQNYDFKFRGPMTLRDALAQSINIPAVKTLYIVGVKDALEFAHKLGIKSLKNDDKLYGLSLVLGGGEISPLELSAAYATFAQEGVYHKPQAILEVKDAAGNVIYRAENQGKEVLDKEAARMLNDVLSDVKAREPAYGRNSFYFKDQDVAVKTGTTNDYRDVWIVGYTPKVVLVTWAGNNDNSPIVKKVAGYVLAPLWRESMEAILEKYKGGSFAEYEKKEYDKPILNGIWFFPNQNPPVHSILHYIDKENIKGPVPKNPYKDPLYPYFEYGVQTWVSENLGNINLNAAATNNITNTNTSTNTNYTPQIQKGISIINPAPSATVPQGRPLKVRVSAQGIRLKEVKYYLDGAYLGTVSANPFSIIIVPQGQNKTHTIKAVGIGIENEQYFAESRFISK